MARFIHPYKRNTPTSTLLKRYSDKKSGRVDEARREIKYRFDYLDWNVQKRILTVFLASGKTDRAWAYTKLLKYWDDSFAPVVESLWNQFHEPKCSWPIIRHFPEEYVLKNMDSLSAENNYYFICRRLGNRIDFCIDKTRLAPLDYLSVLYSTGRDIDKKEALDMLYELIGNHCSTGLIIIELGNPHYITRNIGFNPRDIRDVRRAVYYLQEMGEKESADTFISWCNFVAKEIKESPEFRELASQSVSDYDYVERLANIAVVYMYLNLPLSVMSKITNIENK
jgi:hypothetical protein